MTSREELVKHTVQELRDLLKGNGLPTTGKKDELIERLLGVLQPSGEEPNGQSEHATAQAAPVADAAPSVPSTAQEIPSNGTENEAGATLATDQGQSKHAKIVFGGGAEPQGTKEQPKSEQVTKPAATLAAAQKVLSDQAKLKQRAERFKDPYVDKLKQRAERFQLSHPDIEKEKAVKRAERFGTFHPDIEEQKKLQRMERFGVVDETIKKKARLERFGPVTASGAGSSSDFEEKRKARAARFAGK